MTQNFAKGARIWEQWRNLHILRLGCLECTQCSNTVCDVLKIILKKLIMNLNMCYDNKIKFTVYSYPFLDMKIVKSIT